MLLVLFALVDSDWWRLGLEDWPRADVLSLIQTIFTVVGFGVAIWQLARTASAAESTRDRIASFQARVLGNDLLVLLPELHKIEDDIDTALKKPDLDEVERCLTRYARKSAEAVALLLSDEAPEETVLVKTLKAASKAASKSRSDVTKGGTTVESAARAAMVKMNAASTEVSAAITRRQRVVTDAE